MDANESSQNQSAPTPEKERKYGIQVNPKIYVIAFIIFLCLIIAVGILTRVLPQGVYERQVINDVEYVVDGTYHVLGAQKPLPIWRWFTAPFELMASESGLLNLMFVAVIVIIGGLYAVFDRSGLIQRFLAFIVRRFSKRKYLMLSLITVAFILIGSISGEVDFIVMLVPLIVAISLAMGWDSLIGIGIVFLAAIRGFAASTFNPYTIGIVQMLADVPLYSGLWLRLIILAVTIAVMLVWLVSYARRIEKNPQKSLMYREDAARRESYSYDALMNTTKTKYPFKSMVTDFGKGAAGFLPTIIIVAMIMSLSFILTEGQVIDTVIYRLSNVIANSNPTLAAIQMWVLTMVVEIFISGSFVKAYLLMPIFVPLGDVAGLTRQVICQVFILGDSFPNSLYPTDVMLMMVLSLTGCSYGKWIRWAGPFLLGMMAFCCAVIIFAINVGY